MTLEAVDGRGSARAVGWVQDPVYDAVLDELGGLVAEQGRVFAAQSRLLARLAARTTRDDWSGDAPFASLVMDVAGSCLLGQVAAGSRLLDAEHLVVRLPASLEALEAGDLRVHQVQVLVEQTRDLTPEVCAAVEREVLGRAADLCPADLRRVLRRTVLRLDAEAARRRERAQRRARSTWVRDAGDGMAVLGALLPAEQAWLAHRNLTEHARAARAVGDRRSVDQLRADLLAQQLTGNACCLVTRPPGSVPDPEAPAPVVLDRRSVRPVQVVVHVPLAVALGRSDAPPTSTATARSAPGTPAGSSSAPSCAAPAPTPTPGSSGPSTPPSSGRCGASTARSPLRRTRRAWTRRTRTPPTWN